MNFQAKGQGSANHWQLLMLTEQNLRIKTIFIGDSHILFYFSHFMFANEKNESRW